MVWEEILHSTLAMEPDGSKLSDFGLDFVLNFELLVLFRNQEVQTSRLEKRIPVLCAGTLRSDWVARTVVQISITQNERLMEDIKQVEY